MFRSAATTIGIITLVAGSAFAQGNGRNSARNQGIPPGQMPPAGQCRVWYEGRPPGQQPRATNCDEAERVASRSRTARVIYGSDVRNGRTDRYGRNDDRYGRNDGRYGQDERYGRTNGRVDSGYGFDQGYRDGVTKAQEDMRDGDRYDPARHDWYKSGNRGYDSRYGAKDEYRASYRSGFVQGYDQTYRTSGATTTDRRDGRSIWDVVTGNSR
jgi:hypothetical protein